MLARTPWLGFGDELALKFVVGATVTEDDALELDVERLFGIVAPKVSLQILWLGVLLDAE